MMIEPLEEDNEVIEESDHDNIIESNNNMIQSTFTVSIQPLLFGYGVAPKLLEVFIVTFQN
jgi:hypothetical protein